MYLKALEIQGFKSFADKTVLNFGEAITAIVGPNGSGKSNISDAIRWVMGEQSTKSLRGGKMEDVIFGGTAKRKPLGYAEVSLILDNADGFFHIDETEVMITRRYYRSGESEYYINRHSCRLRDINELFMDTGLGREGYSIIGQGRIDEILSTRSGDRRSVFEEAAGISRFRHRKEESERRLEQTQDNLLRIGDKIAELQLQLDPLMEQASKAKTYLALKETLKGLEISLWMNQLDDLRQRTRKLESDFERAERKRNEVSRAQETLYQRAEEIAEQMRAQDIEADRLRTRLAALDTLCNQMEARLTVLQAEKNTSEQTAQRLEGELEQQAGRAETITAQMDERKRRMEEIAVRRAEVDKVAAAKERESVENQRQSSELAEQLYSLQEREAIETASAAEAKAALSALAAAAQELSDRESAIERQRNESDQHISELREEQKKHRRALNDLKEQSEALGNVISGYRLRLQGREQKQAAATETVNRLTMESNTMQSRIRMLADMESYYEGYSKAVKVVMQAVERHQLRGIHAPVAGLIHVPEEYTIAIEIALGGAMQNLVVSREEDGKEAIQYLKRRDAGRATFLPLTTIRPNALRERGVEQCAGFVGIASDLVSCDAQYHDLIANLLGRTVIAEDMDTAIYMARQYQHRFKIVTLDGQVLNAGGSMTGGSNSKGAGILSRAGELERLRKQFDDLERQLNKARKTLEGLQRERDAAQYEVDTAQKQKLELDSRILRAEGENGQFRLLINALRDNQERWETEQESIQQRRASIEKDTAVARERLTTLEGAAAALRAESAGKEAGRERYRQKSQMLADAIAKLRMEQAALDAEQEAARRSLVELEALQRDLNGDRESRLEQIEACHARSAELRAQLSETQNELAQTRRQQDELNDSLRALTAGRMEQERQRIEADKAARDKNTELLNSERECAMLEQKRSNAAMEERQLVDKLWEGYQLTYDSATPLRQELSSVARASKQIVDLKRQISALGSVNVGAIQEYERVRERWDYLTGQRDDVERSKKELEKIIGDITGEMKNIFQTQFDRINQAFQKTFQELFGGGVARLELDDPENILTCGIEIKVQPPGKVLKTLTLLSGGEKAFVAIALYFAFLAVRPTPFVVMDEIEAALDDSNVARFAAYMRSMSDKTQFIVITHRRGTMEEADILYGVTMQERGISRMLTINLNEAEQLKQSN